MKLIKSSPFINFPFFAIRKTIKLKQILVTTNKSNKYIWMLYAGVCVNEQQNAIKILLKMLLRIFKYLVAIIDDMEHS